MPRDYLINGETLVELKGCSSSALSSLSQLGLAQGPVRVNFEFHHKEIVLDAWGGEVPAEIQVMLAAATITMDLIQFDPAILEAAITESLGGGITLGQVNRAGTRLGNLGARLSGTNHFMGLNLTSPIAGRPYRFYSTYLPQNPIEWPLGTEKSIVRCTFRAIPFPAGSSPGDPWQGGQGAQGTVIFDRTLDT